jgi:hypothetical protein
VGFPKAVDRDQPDVRFERSILRQFRLRKAAHLRARAARPAALIAALLQDAATRIKLRTGQQTISSA